MEKKVRAYKRVETLIRDLIIEGTLKPGDKLPHEIEYSRMLGVSRSTVREAIRSIEKYGLVKVQKGPGGGAFVTDISPSVMANVLDIKIKMDKIPVDHLFEVRSIIEGATAEIAAKKATEEEIILLEQHADITVSDGLTLERRMETNVAFHLLIAQITDNDCLLFIVASLRDALTRNSNILQSLEDSGKSLAAQHFSIVNAIKERKPEKARKAMLKHLESWRSTQICDPEYTTHQPSL